VGGGGAGLRGEQGNGHRSGRPGSRVVRMPMGSKGGNNSGAIVNWLFLWLAINR
jgi:hypothetical protein